MLIRGKVWALAAVAVLGACGKADDKAAGPASSDDAVAAPVSCAEAKAPPAYIAGLTQDLFGRAPTADEAQQALAFDAEAFVDQALAKGEAATGVGKVVDTIFPMDWVGSAIGADDAEADLALEAKTLVLRNLDRPWSYVFETTEAYCTEKTAPLYGTSVSGEGFLPCKLPPERAGLFGLVSVLRSTSPAANPQAFYKMNNNYHRVARALYAVRGVDVQPAEDGPVGELGGGLAVDACVPTTDMRQTKSGHAFGTAAVSLVGSTCASCHSRYHAPLSVAFRRFGPAGELLSGEDVAKLSDDERLGVPAAHLAAILAENRSCWSSDDVRLPEVYTGLPGLAHLAAGAPTLGAALGAQIPRAFGAVGADANAAGAVEAAFKARGGTLTAALRGFFLSQSYRCARRNP